MTTGSSLGYIALDDIELENNACSEPVTCDFERDKCGWDNDIIYPDADLDWIRTTGNNINFCRGPTQDHTFFDEQGHYLYSCFTNKTERLLSSIDSEEFNIKTEKCLSFYLNVINDNQFSMLILMLPDSKQIWTRDDRNKSMGLIKTDKNWSQYQISVPANTQDDFGFLSFIATSLTADHTRKGVAIDDIKLMDYPCGHPKPTTTQLPSTTETYINVNFDTTFENDKKILWGNDGVGSIWEKKIGHLGYSFESPKIDHTTKSVYGHYMLMIPSEYDSEDDNYAILESNNTLDDVTANKDGICIKFWYLMDGTVKSTLNISITDDKIEEKISYSRSGSYGPTWRYGHVYIHSMFFPPDSKILFKGYTMSPGILALDDISVHYHDCPPHELCDFEVDYCNFDYNLNDQIKWQRSDGKNNLYNAPKFDHTTGEQTGKYMFVNPNSTYFKQGITSRLNTPIYKSGTTKRCFQFWYYFYGQDIGAFNVEIKNIQKGITKTLTSEFGSDIDGWQFMQVPLEEINYSFQLSFRVVMNNKIAKIAVDDVEAVDECEPTGSCNFEEDFCVFMNNKAYFEWSRAMGMISMYGPQQDVTLRDPFGSYIYFSIEHYTKNLTKSQQKAVLTSPYLTFEYPITISYWIYRNGINKMPNLTVLLYEYQSLNQTEKVTIVNQHTNQDGVFGKWNFALFNYNNTGVKFRFAFVASVDPNPSLKQFVAVDDINLGKFGHSELPNGQFNCGDNQFVDQSQVCNFHKDCTSGLDEANCGHSPCNFESNNLCNWKVDNITSDLTLNDVTKSKNFPLDHTYSSRRKGHYLINIQPSKGSSDYYQAQFISPVLRQTSTNCLFSFHYIMSDMNKSAELTVTHIPSQVIGMVFPTEIFRVQDEMSKSWKRAHVYIGRINSAFKLSINFKFNSRGNGFIGIDDIQFDESQCAIPQMGQELQCNSTMFYCKTLKRCIAKEYVCDFKDDCGDFTDENDSVCGLKPGRCTFENSICDWQFTDQQHKWTLAAAKDISANNKYAPQRDHTFNIIYGHYLYYLNKANNGMARIESPVMKGSCYLRFYYSYGSQFNFRSSNGSLYDFGKLSVYVRITQNGELWSMYQIQQSVGMVYELINVDLRKMKVPYSVVIEAKSGLDKTGVWVIDDVTFSNECVKYNKSLPSDSTFTPLPVTTSKPSHCQANQYSCDETLCIDKSKVCDFNENCKDQSDEMNCANNFTIGWKDKSMGEFKWDLSKNPMIKKKNENGAVDIAILESNHFGKVSSICLVTFQYKITSKRSQTYNSLKLLFISNDLKKIVPLWQTQNNSDWQFKMIGINIGKSVNWKLQFIAEQFDVESEIQLKDLSFVDCAQPEAKPGKCEQTEWQCENKVCTKSSNKCDWNNDCGDASDEKSCSDYKARCSFDKNNKIPLQQNYCGWHDDANQWKLLNGLDTSDAIGPGYDHTRNEITGFLMVTNTQFNNQSSSASIISPPLYSQNSNNCNIRFWWFSSKGSGTISVLRRYRGTTQINETYSTSSDSDELKWRKIDLPLQSQQDFEVIINVKFSITNFKSYFAIDDVSFTPGCLMYNSGTPKPPTGQCKTNEFQCNDGSCISKQQQCDFIKDCSLAEDEFTCPSLVNYETSANSYWSTDKSDDNPNQIKWSVEYSISAKSKTKGYPPIDADMNTNGHYLLIYSSNTVLDEKSFTLYSPYYKYSTPYCQFSIQYFVPFGSGQAKYSIFIQSDDLGKFDMLNIDTSDKNNQGNWKLISFGVGRRKSQFRIGIRREATHQITETFAIDNIQFINCDFSLPRQSNHCLTDSFECRKTQACIPLSDICDLDDDCADGTDEECDDSTNTFVTFEKDNFKSTFKNGNADFNWKIISGISPNRLTTKSGPPFDHTLSNTKGHYLYLNNILANGQPNKIAKIVSLPIKPTNDGQCRLIFYYYLYGKNAKPIGIFMRYYEDGSQTMMTEIETITMQDEWLRMEIPIFSDKNFEIIIQGSTGNGNDDTVAIDDIILTSGCPLNYETTSLPFTTTMITKSTSVATSKSTSKPTQQCPNGFPYCQIDKKCLPQIAFCNFALDCSDASDEKDCTKLTCGFEYDILSCGFEVMNYDKINVNITGINAYQWKIFDQMVPIKSPNSNLIPRAHDGNKIMLIDGSNGKFDDVTILLSKRISQTHPGCSLEFYYYCHLTQCPLQVVKVYKNEEGIHYDVIWEPIDSQLIYTKNGKWRKGRAFVGKEIGIKIGFQSHKRSNGTYIVALDDVEFKNCAPPTYINQTCSPQQFRCKNTDYCIDSKLRCDWQSDCMDDEDEDECNLYPGRCSFEFPSNCDLQNWHSELYLKNSFEFTSESGEDGFFYLPKFDHTASSRFNRYKSFSGKNTINTISTVDKFLSLNARYASNVIKVSNSDQCRLRFWWNVIGNQQFSLNVYKRFGFDDKKDLILLNAFNSSSYDTGYDTWIRADILLEKTDKPFEVVIEGVISPSSYGSANFDDISFTSGCTLTQDRLQNEPSVTTAKPTDCTPKNRCNNGMCYPNYEKCNFIDNCGDGTDEESCPAECNFDKDCGWYSVDKTKGYWQVVKGESPLRNVGTGPKQGPNGTNSWYLATRNMKNPSDYATYHSPFYSSSGPNCKFVFLYYMFGKNIATLSLYMKDGSDFMNLLTLNEGDHGDQWNRSEVRIGQQKNGFSLYFLVLQESKNLVEYDLANFQFVDCKPTDIIVSCYPNEWTCTDRKRCIDSWRKCDGTYDCDDDSDEMGCVQSGGDCWFNRPDYLDVCRWSNLPKIFNWTLGYKARNTLTGPQDLLEIDNVNGANSSYLYINSADHEPGDTAAIAGQWFNASDGVCHLSFYYYMWGSTEMGTLRVRN